MNSPLELKTEPMSVESIYFMGVRNPAPFAERTIINRGEALKVLSGHEISLVIPKELEELLSRNPRKPREIFDDPYLKLDPKVTVEFMTAPSPGHPSKRAKFSLSEPSFFTLTSKMSAPSWSIPAGPQAVGGTCAAAELFKNSSKYDLALGQGEVEERTADKKTWICAACYAGKSNYMHRTSQYAQTARMIWLHGMVKHHGVELTADTMARALTAHMANVKKREAVGESTQYFRVHDSGDLELSPNTYLLWRQIASYPELSHIHFWIPSRMWTFPKFNDLVQKNPPPTNLSLRPSALHFGDKAPEIEGWSAGSTAHDKKRDPVKDGIADWSCPAYTHAGHSCQGAGGPNGERDCRVCWDHKDMKVSYRSH